MKNDYKLFGKTVYVNQRAHNDEIAELNRVHDLKVTQLQEKAGELARQVVVLQKAHRDGSVGMVREHKQLLDAYKKEMISRGQKNAMLENVIAELGNQAALESLKKIREVQ